MRQPPEVEARRHERQWAPPVARWVPQPVADLWHCLRLVPLRLEVVRENLPPPWQEHVAAPRWPFLFAPTQEPKVEKVAVAHSLLEPHVRAECVRRSLLDAHDPRL